MQEEIRILTLWEPWASLIALQLKRFETRSWGSDYRGKLAIHAAKRKIKKEECSFILDGLTGDTKDQLWDALCKITAKPSYGHIVAVADLRGCYLMLGRDFASISEAAIRIADQTPLESAVGDWSPGRYAWKLDNIIPLSAPIPFTGNQGLQRITDESVLKKLRQAA